MKIENRVLSAEVEYSWSLQVHHKLCLYDVLLRLKHLAKPFQ